MNTLLIFLIAVAVVAIEASPVTGGIGGPHNGAFVEIEKQRLIKFPEDQIEQRYPQPTKPNHNQEAGNTSNSDDEEAKRILAQIEKVNEAFGYVKKQSAQPKMPPILDSSQYLFPKPAYHPYHENNHQFSNPSGETLLVPSIRAYHQQQQLQQQLQQQRRGPYYTTYLKYGSAKAINYNTPPRNSFKEMSSDVQTTNDVPILFENLEPIEVNRAPLRPIKDFEVDLPDQRIAHVSMEAPDPIQYYFRPNEVHVPVPENLADREQLPAHFAIPVRLFHLNKDEYIKKYAPHEYRVKGYKIVGDVDNFFGKARRKSNSKAEVDEKKKTTPKYHLFFLPRELVLNEDSTFKHPNILQDDLTNKRIPEEAMGSTTSSDNGSREEKLANRPNRLPGGLPGVFGSSQKNGQSNGTTTQVIRKRIIPKPLREKESIVAVSPSPQKPYAPVTVGYSGENVVSTSTIKITPPSLPLQTQNVVNVPLQEIQSPNVEVSENGATSFGNRLSSALGFITNRPTIGTYNTGNVVENPIVNAALSGSQPSNGMRTNTTAVNVIKNAFQNIFKMPFRPDKTNSGTTAIATGGNLENVPLQVPQKTIFGTFPPQFLSGQSQQQSPQSFFATQRPALMGNGDDYYDGGNSNSAAEDEEVDAEKQIFGNRQQQETQKEAIKQGGIIIQRLKVRKGGIAIAGPGGVATAGSGGTAIVGPGGYALTHPRSLTIAGPGAKIIAIPANVDLRDALERTNIGENTFPREGRIVAMGPTIYYSPTTTGTAPDASTDE